MTQEGRAPMRKLVFGRARGSGLLEYRNPHDRALGKSKNKPIIRGSGFSKVRTHRKHYAAGRKAARPVILREDGLASSEGWSIKIGITDAVRSVSDPQRWNVEIMTAEL